MKEYSKIRLLKGLEGIQVRPDMYVGDTSTNEGLTNCFFEVVANSFDEHLAGFGNLIEVSVDSRRKWFAVRDYGRGIPNEWNSSENKFDLELIFTHIHSGAKFDNESYTFSSGLHGVGNTAVNALAEFLICVSQRQKQSVVAFFRKGKVSNINLHKGIKDTGTYVLFKPNKAFLPSQDLDKDTIERKLEGLVNVSPKLKILFSWNKKKRLISSQGLISCLNLLTAGKHSVVEPHFNLEVESPWGRAKAVFTWTYDFDSKIVSYTNGTEQSQGGTHTNQFMLEVRKVLNGLHEDNLSLLDVREGLRATLSVMISNPHYSSQTKEKLTSTEGRKVVKDLFERNSRYFYVRKLELKKVLDYLKSVSKKRQEYIENRMPLEKKKENAFSSVLPGKLLDCISKDIQSNELFITEGDSAGATAKAGRSCEFQAIIPIRGKIINAERASFKKLINFESVRNLIVAVGTNIGKQFNYEDLRYGKIIFMTDADCDGYHIRAALIGLFYRYMPKLVEMGHVYVATPHLFKLSDRKQEFHFLTRKDMELFLIKKSGFKESTYLRYRDIRAKLNWDPQLMNLLESLVSGLEIDSLEPVRRLDCGEHIALTLGYASNLRRFIFRKPIIDDFKEMLISENRKSVIKELEQAMEKSRFEVRRYKGLGQMNHNELWDKVMNPETRILRKVSVDQALNYSKILNLIMGESPSYRKHLVDQGDLSIYELDI